MLAFGWHGWETDVTELILLLITFAGIIYGLGVALSSSKLKRFGSDEIIQGIINAAIVGAIIGVVAILSTFSSGFYQNRACGTANESVYWLECSYTNLSQNLSTTNQELIETSYIVGYYQSIVLSFGNGGSGGNNNITSLKIQPLKYLDGVLASFKTSMTMFNLIYTGLGLDIVIFAIIGATTMTFILPFGILLRSFFATRKLGGFLIALSIGLFIIYPLFILPFNLPHKQINNTNAMLQNFTSNSNYATDAHLIDLNTNGAIASKIDNLSTETNGGGNGVYFVGDITKIIGSVSQLTGSLFFYVILVPLFSLLITIVSIKETYDLVSGEFDFFSWTSSL